MLVKRRICICWHEGYNLVCWCPVSKVICVSVKDIAGYDNVLAVRRICTGMKDITWYNSVQLYEKYVHVWRIWQGTICTENKTFGTLQTCQTIRITNTNARERSSIKGKRPPDGILHVKKRYFPYERSCMWHTSCRKLNSYLLARPGLWRWLSGPCSYLWAMQKVNLSSMSDLGVGGRVRVRSILASMCEVEKEKRTDLTSTSTLS
jgi:hypothetical protein